MEKKKTARRCCNTRRASVQSRDAAIIAQREYERATRIAAVILGLMFGAVFFLGLIGG